MENESEAATVSLEGVKEPMSAEEVLGRWAWKIPRALENWDVDHVEVDRGYSFPEADNAWATPKVIKNGAVMQYRVTVDRREYMLRVSLTPL